MTLEQAINTSPQRGALRRHLTAHFGKIPRWGVLSTSHLNEFRDYLLSDKSGVCQSAARTYAMALKSVISQYCDKPASDKYDKILTIPDETPVKIYLTLGELNDLERYEQLNDLNASRKFVLEAFLVGAKTGCRFSDIMELTPENYTGNTLIYTAKKTSITVQMPIGAATKKRIEYCQQHYKDMRVSYFNYVLRDVCKVAGITTPVKVFKAGKSLTGEKWKFVSSHTARISFATNLSRRKVPIADIAKLMGHKNINTTANYIVYRAVELTQQQEDYFY